MTSPGTLLKAWQIKPKKQLGQNFLLDPATAKMIVRRSQLLSDDTVLEIGAGLGSLTIPLAHQVRHVMAVETDGRLIGLLKTELTVNHLQNVEVIQTDILKLDIVEMVHDLDTPDIVVMGNLPYHISSQIMVKLIQSRQVIRSAVLMFQKELAQRLMATPNCKEYGRLSVMVQYCADIHIIADIPATSFYPRPRVDSQVIAVTFKSPHFPATDESVLNKVIKAAFGRRRKTLRNSLAGSGLGLDTATAATILSSADIDPSRRAETLSVDEFVKLSNCYYDLQRGSGCHT